MRLSATILLTCVLAATAGCAKSPADQQTSSTQQNSATEQTASASPAPGLVNVNATPNANATPDAAQTATPKSDVDPCALLTSDEIRAVQGEPLKETKPSRQSASGLIGLQCYYALSTSANSVSLALTETDPANSGGATARQYWQKTFHNSEEAEPEREGRKERDEKEKERNGKGNERTQKSSGGREEEDGEATPPKPVRGLGDEAFWTASRFGGALYVLKGQRFIRLSVGGADDEQTRLTKTETLARAALRRL
jgi:hypothetical protein